MDINKEIIQLARRMAEGLGVKLSGELYRQKLKTQKASNICGRKIKFYGCGNFMVCQELNKAFELAEMPLLARIGSDKQAHRGRKSLHIERRGPEAPQPTEADVKELAVAIDTVLREGNPCATVSTVAVQPAANQEAAMQQTPVTGPVFEGEGFEVRHNVSKNRIEIWLEGELDRTYPADAALCQLIDFAGTVQAPSAAA